MKMQRVGDILAVFVLIIFLVWACRAFSSRQIDDVSPGIQCDAELLNKADVFYVIPQFENQTPTKEGCDSILSLNKDLRMHGVVHSYNEFAEPRSPEYIQEGRETFKNCFGFYPERFKAPQLNISKENAVLIKQTMRLDTRFDEVFHKVYHCNDTGIFSNRLVDWI